MNHIQILDCTLRDGGYINSWNFGYQTIRGIIEHLKEANLDIIECGFLRDVPYRKEASVFSAVDQIAPLISPKQEGRLYVAMIALGDIDPSRIAPRTGDSINGIRLTFHKHEWEQARVAAMDLMEKGYEVFIQPVGTTSYSDEELLHLIHEVNLLRPYAFYLVDTLGILYRKDLLRFFYLIDHNMEKGIHIGFHSHNNLQLSFANAQELLRINTKRDIILDASVYGMGRGVGNLSTELLAEYINTNIKQQYKILPLLSIADQYLMSIYADHPWGYALPYFLSAIENCHPNYASYLMQKETLNIDDIFKLLNLIPRDQRELFHPELIETLYLNYQTCQIQDEDTIAMIAENVVNRGILVLAPGRTLRTQEAEIHAFIKRENPCVIAINFVPEHFKTDFLFFSNRKRLESLSTEKASGLQIVATSNLKDELPSSVHFVNYTSYLGEGRAADNAGALLLRVLKKAGAAQFVLAGFDGFDVDSSNNYCVDSYKTLLERSFVEQKNEDIGKQLRLAAGETALEFLTPTKYTEIKTV